MPGKEDKKKVPTTQDAIGRIKAAQDENPTPERQDQIKRMEEAAKRNEQYK